MTSDSLSYTPGYLETPRLRLVPATVELVNADLAGPDALAAELSAQVPDDWPPELSERLTMENMARRLQSPAGRGWAGWYITDRTEPRQAKGLCWFKDRPDARGSVEIAYSICAQFRNTGIATEAVGRLVDWAFTRPGVTEVQAETMPHLQQSIRVLEKAGFRPAGPGSELGVIRYAISRPVQS